MPKYTPVKEYSTRIKYKDGTRKYFTVSGQHIKLERLDNRIHTIRFDLPPDLVICKVEKEEEYGYG